MFEDLAETAEEARVVGVLCDSCIKPFKAEDLVIGIIEWDVNSERWIHATTCR